MSIPAPGNSCWRPRSRLAPQLGWRCWRRMTPSSERSKRRVPVVRHTGAPAHLDGGDGERGLRQLQGGCPDDSTLSGGRTWAPWLVPAEIEVARLRWAAQVSERRRQPLSHVMFRGRLVLITRWLLPYLLWRWALRRAIHAVTAATVVPVQQQWVAPGLYQWLLDTCASNHRR